MADRRPLLMLIDGPSLVYRGYFALPPLTLSDGTLVNAVFGFLQIVLRGMQDVKPDYAIVSFDIGKPQFRFDAYPDYKRGRPSMPDDLRSQFPIVREIAAMMNIPIRELEGYEADDVIGTLTKRATAAGRRHDDRLRRPRRAPARRRPREAADDPDGRGGDGDLRRGEGHGALRPSPRPDARLQGTQGRHERQHPRRAGRGGEDREQPAPAVRDARWHLRASRRGEGQAPRSADRASRVGIHVARGRSHRPGPAGRARPRGGAHGPIRPAGGRAAFPRARVPVADRPAAGVEHRADRLRLAGAGHEGRPPAQPRPARRQGAAPDASAEPAPRPDPLSDPAGAIEHVDPRIVRSSEEMEELSSWLEAHGDAVGLGWAVGNRPAAGTPPVRDRPCGRRRVELVRAMRPFERRDRAAAGVVRSPGAASRRSRPEAAAGDAGRRPWDPAPGELLRHPRRRLHGQPGAPFADDRRHGGHALRGDAAAIGR